VPKIVSRVSATQQRRAHNNGLPEIMQPGCVIDCVFIDQLDPRTVSMGARAAQLSPTLTVISAYIIDMLRETLVFKQPTARWTGKLWTGFRGVCVPVRLEF